MNLSTAYCTGCGTCELACSFHHSGTFCPSISSIEIIDQPASLGFEVAVYLKPEKGRRACDGCRGLDGPLCVQYCPAIARKELREIITGALFGNRQHQKDKPPGR